MEADLQQVLDIEAIKKLKARYFRLIDTKDWAGFAQVFAEDARMLVPEADVDITGRDAITESISALLDGVQTVHHGHMPEIRLTSNTTATDIWALQDTIIWPDGSRLLGFGHYHESYELVENEWRIKELTLTRLHMEISNPPTGST